MDIQRIKIMSLRSVLVLSLLLGCGNVGAIWAAAAPTTPTTPTTMATTATVSTASNEVSMANMKFEQWTGHSFTFLTLPADKQAAGYEIFTENNATQGLQGDASVRIAYTQHVGKQVTVTAIAPFNAGDNQKDYMVHMTVNDTGEKLIGRSLCGQLEGLILTADLENAKKQFLGKIIYPKFRMLSGLYIPGVDTMPQTVTTTIGYPVTVVDVYAGNQSQEPIWLIVVVHGEKAVLPIAYSWTNIIPQSWTQTPPWQDALFMENPRISLGGSDDLWNQIQGGNVQEGMTKGQVHLSWGKPLRVEKNDSIWIYGTQKLSFHGDVLYAVEAFLENP